MDNDTPKKEYFTRSKARETQNTDEPPNSKPDNCKKYRKIEKLKKDDDNSLNVLKANSKIKIGSDATSFLTALILDKALEHLNIDIDEDDLDFEPIKGLPEEINYMESEEKYVKNLCKKDRKRIIKREKEILNLHKQTKPQRFKILESNLNISTKSSILKKLDRFYTMEPSENEYHKLSQWSENLDKIPFDIYSKPKVKITSSSSKIIKHLKNVKKTMDKAVYGHNIAKNQIIQIIAQQITNPKCTGNCIAIQGPPGNGKTTLIREGICKSINRPFASIPLGGMQNSDFLVGHDYTYEGSKPGRIVEILMECRTMDPVIYFDELDKLSNSPKGQEIANLLCHLTDLSQNSEFHDKYFSGIDFDISKAIFIFSYNDESLINPILLDRMIKINTDGFKSSDKVLIAKNYLIPSVCKSINFPVNDILFTDDVLKYIIDNRTNNEAGVRNLRRCLEAIVSKINVLKLINGFSKNNKEKSVKKKKNKKTKNKKRNITINVSKKVNKLHTHSSKKTISNDIVSFDINGFKLPIKITSSILEKLLNKKSKDETSKLMMYI